MDLSHGAWTFSNVGTGCTATSHMTSLLVYSPFSQELSSSLSLNLIWDTLHFATSLPRDLVTEGPACSVTDHDSMHMVDTCKCVTTKGTRGSGDPGVAGRGASRGLGTQELGSVRTGFPFRSDCQSEADLGSAYRLAPQSLGP